ncbi:MAG: IS256 family transposase [Bacteroidota bacterium]
MSKEESKNHPILKAVLDNPEARKALEGHLKSGKDLFGKESPFTELLQGMVNVALEGELDAHLEEDHMEGRRNKRNGHTSKQVLSSSGELTIKTPRDRKGSFEPELVAKRSRQLQSGLDDQIIALYAQGNSVEDVRRLLHEFYGVSISAGKISTITDRVLVEISDWQQRPLLAFYVVIYLDAIHFNVRHEGKYESRAFYTVYGTDIEGNRDLLGMFIFDNEGAKSWGLVLEDLQRRGVEDVLFFCTDNLQGFSESIKEVFPTSIIQKCIVHQMRNSTRFCDEKDRKEVVKDLKKIYQSASRTQAQLHLEAFEAKWGKKYGHIVKSWTDNWEELTAFMDYPKDLRRILYTTNPVEALHRIMRKMVKSKAAWVSDQALIKQLYLSLMYNQKSWRKKTYNWKVCQRAMIKQFGERVTKHLSI